MVTNSAYYSGLGWLLDHPFSRIDQDFFFEWEFLVSALLGFRVFGVFEGRPAFKIQKPGLAAKRPGHRV